MITITSGLRRRIRKGVPTLGGIREFVVGTGGKTTHRLLAAPQPNSEARNEETFGFSN